MWDWPSVWLVGFAASLAIIPVLGTEFMPPFDLDMARAAGVPSLAVGHGFYSQEALAACGPRAYAPDTAALKDILLAWAEG